MTVKVLEDCHVSPPPNSVPSTTLSLTFFDIPWLLCRPMQRIFFYKFPHSTLHFTNTILPSLKHSLSLTLQHFFPFSGTLICPPQPIKPHILYVEGDSIPLTIAESSCDFVRLLNNQPQDVGEFHPLVPQFQLANCVSNTATNGQVLCPLLALQVTIFPNSGISIGITFRHVVADGRSSNHFMKSWASIFRSNGDLSCIHKSVQMPFYDRSVIEDSKGLETIFLNQWWTWRSFLKEDTTTATATATNNPVLQDKFRATFVMGRSDIERLKQWISTQLKNGNELIRPFHLSTFVVTCSLIWACLIKSQISVTLDDDDDDDKLHNLCFVADCRKRGEIQVPITYFGNCLAICFLSAMRGELVGENGVIVAAKAIGSKVKELENGVLKGAENWMSDWNELAELGHIVTVSGSPKLGVYETDFGWGRPKKSEVVQIDISGAISIAECRDEEGGIEVGLALSKVEMEAFISIFEETRKRVMFSTC